MNSYFFNDSTINIFSPENTFEKCNDKYKLSEKQKQIDFLQAKAALLDKEIWKTVKPIYSLIKSMDIYFSNKKDKKINENYQEFQNIKKISFQDLKLEEEDKYFFSKFSSQPYIINGDPFFVDYLHIVNNFVKDFNSNYFEYYLMAQHAEQYNCCFIYTFRKLSEFISRTFNCPFFYCLFDDGVDNYIKDIQKNIINRFKNVSKNLDDNGNIISISINKDISKIEMNLNLELLIQYLGKRKKFIDDLKNFYNRIFKFIEKFLEFLAGLKVMLKIISIINIILNSHNDDTRMFLEHVNSLTNLINTNVPSINPALVDFYYEQYAQIFQTDVIPDIITMKINFEKDAKNNKLTPYEKNRVNHVFIMFALGSVGLITKCQDLFSNLSDFNNKIKKIKKEWSKNKNKNYIENFIAETFQSNLNKKLIYPDPCYVPDYDNPPSIEYLKKLQKQVKNCKKAGYNNFKNCPDNIKHK